MGSARESRDWYYKARYGLQADVTDHRLQLLTQIIRLLLMMVPQQREHVLRDGVEEYSLDTPLASFQTVPDENQLLALLQDVPLP